MNDLFSKVLAGGLSAGIFLLWWPAHAPTQGADWLIARGLLWALAFEVLLLSFLPLERLVARRLRDRRDRSGVRARLAATTPHVRTGGAVVLASAGLVVPALLLQGVHPIVPPAAKAAERKVIVKREVRREVVVRRVVRTVGVQVPVAAPAPVASRAPARRPKSTGGAGRNAEPSAATGKKEEAPAATAPAPAPATAPEVAPVATPEPAPAG